MLREEQEMEMTFNEPVLQFDQDIPMPMESSGPKLPRVQDS